MKKAGYYLLIAGLAAQAVDALTYKAEKGGGALFGQGGLLAPVDQAVPKIQIFGVPSNVAFWVIIVGLAMVLFAR